MNRIAPVPFETQRQRSHHELHETFRNFHVQDLYDESSLFDDEVSFESVAVQLYEDR